MKMRLLLLLSMTYSLSLAAQAQPSAPAGVNASPVASLEAAPPTAARRIANPLPPEVAPPIRIPRLAARPVIDGRLDEEVWQQAVTLRDFYQTQPGDNSDPSRATEVLLAYDERHLYIAFRAFDDPRQVRATVARRDAVLDDDNVRIYLDTFNDRRRAYVLVFNPLGVQQDGIMTEERGEDYSVDLLMESKGQLTADGYTVEVAVPFSSLRYEAGAGRFWGLHLFRRIKHLSDEQNSWMPIARGRSGLLNQAARMTGLEGINTERTLEIIPSLTISQTGRRARSIPRALADADPALRDPGRFVNSPIEFEPGLTAKFTLTPSITLDLALNPDFAQVEADQTIVTANQRFPVFFEEKRPFFLEGIEIFQTPMSPVHTRAIVDPDIGIKLTGRRGRNTFGLLLASDAAPGNFNEEEREDPANARFLDRNAYIGVLRARREIGREGHLGVLATSYNFIERHNDLLSIDGRFRFNPQTVFTFQAIGTTSRRYFYDAHRDERIYRTGNGFGYAAMLHRTTRNFFVELLAAGRTRDYRADVGFTPRTNHNNNVLFIRYQSDPRTTGRFRLLVLTNFNRAQYDWQGRILGWNTGGRAFFNFRRQTWFGFGFDNFYEQLFEEEFGARRTATRAGAFYGAPTRAAHNRLIYFGGGTMPSRAYYFRAEGTYQMGALDLDGGAGARFPRVSPAALAAAGAPRDPGPGNLFTLNANFTYQPTDAFNTALNYTRNRLVRHDTGRVAFDDQIYSLRATYQFTRFLFARARIDYTTLASRVRGQFLFGWAPNPGTALYVGYNDDMNRSGFNPFTGQLEPGLRRNGRTFFIKLSYLYRRSIGG